MKILLTSDLHGTRDWYEWIIGQAGSCDLACIAGDLFDMFDDRGLVPQIAEFDKFVDRFRDTRTALAFCTGNHDWFDFQPADKCLRAFCSIQENKERLASIFNQPYWTDGFDFPGEPGRGGVIPDNRVRMLTFPDGEKLLVSTVPYSDNDEARISQTWEIAAELRRSDQVAWLALCHEPPCRSRVGGDDGSELVRRLIDETAPTYVIGGHLHQQPYAPDGSWADQISATWCFNPGHAYLSQAAAPNHIRIDTVAKTAIWVASPSEHQIVTEERLLADLQ